MEHQSPLKKFNNTVTNFIEDLKNIFGETDRDLMKLESAMDLTSVNARIIMTPFQNYALQPVFVRGILTEDMDLFLNFNYGQLVNETEYMSYLLNKLKAVAVNMKGDRETITKIFNWFKMLLYYAFEDQGKNPVNEFKSICSN